jgi:hypothetical protein
MGDSGMAEESGKDNRDAQGNEQKGIERIGEEAMSKSTEELRHEARDADRLVVELTAEARGLPRKIEAAARGHAEMRRPGPTAPEVTWPLLAAT